MVQQSKETSWRTAIKGSSLEVLYCHDDMVITAMAMEPK
jgi:hypothetical protein